MKKILYLSIPMLLLASCNDDFGKDKENKPVPTPGEDVEFTCSSGDALSRTIYADEDTTVDGNTAWRINWLDGDRINVFTPQGPSGFQLAPYQVVNKRDPKPDTEEVGPQSVDYLNYALQLNKVNQYGVRWGETAEQDFYAVYPYSTATNQIFNSGTAENPNVVITAKVESNQVNTAPFYTNGSNVFVKGDMPNNIMWAHKKERNGADYVDLRFHAATTVIQFQFDGLIDYHDTPQPMTIQEVKLTTNDETKKIAGTMSLSINEVDGKDVATYTLTEGTSNSVAVATQYDNVFVEMAADGTATVNMFLAIPSGDPVSINGWTVSVKAAKGTFTKELKNEDVQGKITPGSINIIKLPKFKAGGAWKYDLATWMKDIPNKVYWTELSIPGSWYSASSGTSDAYQNLSIQDQFKNGVRAFHLETRVSMNSVLGVSVATASDVHAAMERNAPDGIWRPIYSYVGISGTGSNQDAFVHDSIQGYKDATPIDETIKTIIKQVKATPSEFAILTLSYSDGGKSGGQTAWRCRWLEKIQYCLDNLGSEGSGTSKYNYIDYIYKGTLGPNTTVNDLRGFLVLKINIDSESEIKEGGKGVVIQRVDFDHVVPSSVFSNIPALFSHTSYGWSSVSTETEKATPLTSNLTWKAIPTIPTEIIKPTSDGFWCSYTSANRTLTDTGLHPNEADRKDAISSLIQQSSDYYKTSNHNLFFFIGAGGTKAPNQEASAESNGPTQVANVLNPYLKTEITKKLNANQPSPLGCVYFNFVGGQTEEGGLIRLIIDMNNKFYLKRVEDTNNSVRSAAPGYSSGMVDNNQNAIGSN